MGAYSALASVGYGKLTPYEFSLYAYLLAYAERQGWPREFRLSAAWLMKATGSSINTVRNARSKLKSLGLIDTRCDGGKMVFRVPQPQASKAEYHEMTPEYHVVTPEYREVTPEYHEMTPAIYNTNNNICSSTLLSSYHEMTPPTAAEVAEYAQKLNINVDAALFHAYYEERNWTDTSGQPIRNWKALLTSWRRENGTDKHRNSNRGYKREILKPEDYADDEW